MKKLNVKKVFFLIMFLWIVNILCVVWLVTVCKLLFTLLFEVGIIFVYGFIIWDMLQRIVNK